MPEDLVNEDKSATLPPHRTWVRGGTRPVLALHCSLAHAGAWGPLAERLTGVTLTATDQPGHGRAADWDGVSDLHKVATEGSIAIAERLGHGHSIDLIGHSFGGTVALRVALQRPDLVRSLTLIEPVLFAAAHADPAFAAFQTHHARVVERLQAGDHVAALRLFQADWGAGEALESLPEKTRTYMLDRIALIGAQNAVLMEDTAGLLRGGSLEELRVPVLLIEGGNSPAIIGAIHTALAARLPNVQRLVVQGAGHMLPITHPQLVAPAVQAHLDGC